MVPATGGGHLHGDAELASATGEAAHGHDDGTVEVVDADGNVIASDGHGHDDGSGSSDSGSSAELASSSAGHDDHGSTANSTSGGSTATTSHTNHSSSAASTTNGSGTTTTTAHDHGTATTGTTGTTAPGQTTTTISHDHGTTTTTTTTTPPVVAAWRMGATDAQVANTRSFVAATRSAVATFTSFDDAAAKGYVKIADDHMLKVSYMLDDKITDPSAIESLVIERRGGVDVITGGMYLLNIGQDEGDAPTFGGPLVVWHRHGGFCFDENVAIVGLADPVTGECPPNTMFIDDPPMVHIWTEPVKNTDGTTRTDSACGTFAYMDGPHDAAIPGCTDGSHQH